MRNSKISWTEDCWNVTDGCSREMAEGAETSGCGDPTGGGCYAERMAYRFSGPGKPYEGLVRMTPNGARWTGKLRLNVDRLDEPLRWRGNRLVFVCSTSDPFHPKLTNEQIAAIYGAAAATGGRHIFQMLTKRARRRREWFAWVAREAAACNGGVGMTIAAFCFAILQKLCDSKLFRRGDVVDAALKASWPLPNVWEGASVEHQAAAYDRIDHLLMTPATLRWLSIEPMIGPVDLLPWLDPTGACDCPPYRRDCVPRCMKDAEWRHTETDELDGDPPTGERIAVDPQLHWIVAGAESGSGSRPADVEWFRTLRDQCADYGLKFFLKQAEHTPGDFVSAATLAMGRGDLSKTKRHRAEAAYATGRGDLLELPYLDGRVHAEIPGRHLMYATGNVTTKRNTWG